MPENPIYNPNNIVRKEPVPVYNPNNIVKKEVIDTRVFSEDPNVKMPEYTTPKDLEIDSAINFINKQAVESGRVALTEERKSVLKDVLKNPNATKEQKEQAMLTVQGYDKDTSGDVSNKFYMQQDVNGVYVPKLLKHGQRPPKGTAINSFHGTQSDANDDAWYTDLSEAAGGVVDLAQAGQQLITGEESEILNDARNSVDFFKFKKDEDLNKSIYNTEGITKWADLLDKDRIDISPSALWGTFNGLTESLSEFGFGTMVGGSLIKGAKGAKYALQGVDKAVELGSAAQKSAIVFGSTIAQLGDVMEAGKEAGLKGRDLPAFALATATAMGTIDAMTGLEGKVMSDLFKKSKSQILKNAIKTVERDAVTGEITPQAFKELAKRTSIQYGEMARNAGKEIVKDAIGEGTQEAVQDFTQKAAENLWDKMTDDERGQFGTDAFDAKSFGSYLNSFATGVWSGVPMAIQQQAFKKRNEEQSIHVYDRVKQGEEGVKALRVDLNEALANNDISQSEYEQANFKIDKYQQYHELTSKYNIDPKDEKRAFELSFQIEGMKTEIPTDENLISKMKPLERSDVEADQSQVKTLQKELNEIILRAKVKGEPTVGKKTEETIVKEKEKVVNEEASKVEGVLKEQQSNAKLRQKESAKEPNPDFPIEPKVEKKPERAWITDKRTYDEIPAEEWNHSKTDERLIHKVASKHIWNQPNHEVNGQLYLHQYEYNGKKNRTIRVKLEDGKILKLGSTKIIDDSGLSGYFHTERLKGNVANEPVGIKVVELAPEEVDVEVDGKMTKKVIRKKVIKLYQKSSGKYLAYIKETHKGSKDAKDRRGNPLYTQEQISGELEDIKLQDEKELPPDEVERLRNTPITPVVPKTVKEKAKEATDKIVEESKAKVKEQKASVPLTITKAVRQQLLDLGFSNANVDLMKPERALEIINKQETNKKEVSAENESAEKEPNVKKDSVSLRRKITGYNQLSSNDKKSDFGVNLRKEIQKEVEGFGGSLKPLNKGKVQLLDSEGKQVKKESVKREQSVIDAEKSIAKKRKDALNATPTTPEQYLAIVIGSKGQFSESVTKEIPDVPSMMKDFKNGYTLESLYQEYQERSGFYGINEDGFNTDANNFLSDYLTKGGRDLAIDYAVEAYEKNINGGRTDKELADEVAYGESLGLKEQEVAVIQEAVQNLNEEEVTELETKIENTNEKDRNEKFANETIKDIAGEKGSNSNPFDESESEQNEEVKDIVRNESTDEPFQKVSSRKGDVSKVIAAINKALPKVKIVEKDLDGRAGRWNPKENAIEINPNYAGLDTPIHEAAHVFIDAIGYDNKIIQAAIKQLKTTPLYEETKKLYGGLDERGLDMEVLAEAIGREGADIFDNISERSKFKAYLDYIFDWLKQKLGLDKNIAKSLSKQILGGVKTSNLEAVKGEIAKDQKVKENKKPFAAQALKYNQYAMEEGFDAQIEFEKHQKALVELKEAEEIEQDVLVNGTQEEYKEAEKEYKAAKKEYAIKAKKYLGYKKYQKDFREVQALLEDKDLEDYTYEELNDLSIKLHSFNDRAAKSLKARVHLKIGHKATIKQNEIHKKNEGFIEALGKTSDISPLKRKILHISHFSEKNADIQALALASGKAIIDKLSEANSLKDIHAKLGLKVIQEENKRLGITGMAANRFSSDSSKYFEWMINEDGNYLTIDEAKAKGLSKAKLDYLDFHRETVAGYRESMSENNYENVKMAAIRVDKNFREAYKSEGLIPAFSYYLGGGATNLGRVRILHNGKIMSYSEIEKEIISSVDKKSIQSIAKALYDLLVANIKARYQLKKGQNIDEKDNPLELKGDAEYSLNEKGQLVSKFDKPRNKDRGYSKDFYKAMNQFIDESAHVKHISKIMPLVEAVEYLNKNGYAEEGYTIKPNVAKWIDDWKALHIFKEPHVNDPIIDAAVKSLRKLVASTTMWFNLPANAINVFVGNYNNWRAENAETLAKGNARLFGGKGSRKEVGIVNDYALAIIKKYNLVNQDFDSHPVIKAGSVFSKLATWGTQVGEYQIQGSLGLGLLNKEEFDSFEFTEDKYGNKVLTVKEGVDEEKLKAKMTQVKNRVTDIQGKYPDEDRRNIMRGEFGKALFQFKVWMPDWFKERFGARYINAYGQEKEGSYTKMLRVGVKEMASDLKKGDIKKALTNPAFVTNLKGMVTIGSLLALKHSDDDDDDKRKGGLNWDSVLSQVLFIFDLEQDKYMVSNPAAVLGKIKDLLNAFEALIGFEEDAWQKTKRIIPGNKAITFGENLIK